MANNKSGIFGDPTLGCAKTPLNPKLVRSPIYELAECENVREYPQKNHWKPTIPTDIKESQMRESADFRRARPE